MRLGAKTLMVGAVGLAVALVAAAQGGRKPGLWEITTSMSWQQSPFPQGMQLPPQVMAALNGAPHTTQYCLTQAMIDKYGAPIPESHQRCQVANVSKTADGMTADMICSSPMMNGKGSMESHWSADGTARGKVHFVGTMQMGGNTMPMEWTSMSTSVYKGADCGDVQPPPMPKDQ